MAAAQTFDSPGPTIRIPGNHQKKELNHFLCELGGPVPQLVAFRL